MGWLLPRDWPPATDLPALTAGVLWLVRALRFPGPLLAAGGVWAVRRLAAELAPGTREFRCAAQLLQLAAAPDPGAPGLSMVPPALLSMEQWYFNWRRALAGAPVAARELAAELLRAGRQKAERFNQVAPIGAAAAAFMMFSVVVLGMYLPLFNIAGSIR
jgi:hypothetical protein